MRRTLVALVAIAGLATLALAGGAVAASSPTSVTKIHVIEHATTDAVIDVGDPGDSTGDLLTFHNKLFDATDTNVVGRDQGDCVRIDPAKGTWECRWTNILEGGQITVEDLRPARHRHLDHGRHRCLRDGARRRELSRPDGGRRIRLHPSSALSPAKGIRGASPGLPWAPRRVPVGRMWANARSPLD